MSTHIQWTDETWNPTVGCTRVSAGCDHCYAVRHTQRLSHLPVYAGLVNDGKRHFNGTVRTVPNRLGLPLSWRKPRRVFVNSMSDLFHPDVPIPFILQVFEVMARCPQHTFQILTKRPERMAYCLTYPRDRLVCESPEHHRLICTMPLPNVWLGTSVETQDQQERIMHLLRVPAVVLFLSLEPLLGPIRLWKLTKGDYIESPHGAEVYPLDGLYALPDHDWEAPRKIGWVIVGGESGPSARDCDIRWIRDIKKQCADADTPLFVKQLGRRPYESVVEPGSVTSAGITLSDPKGGDPSEWPEDLRVRESPEVVVHG